MATATARIHVNTNVCGTKKTKPSLKERFLNYYRENQIMISCGLLSMNPNTNPYTVYRSLTK